MPCKNGVNLVPGRSSAPGGLGGEITPGTGAEDADLKHAMLAAQVVVLAIVHEALCAVVPLPRMYPEPKPWKTNPFWYEPPCVHPVAGSGVKSGPDDTPCSPKQAMNKSAVPVGVSDPVAAAVLLPVVPP